ncbi:F-box [Glarea lozoyensis ATCC 20868]|uniref:F-box n=1 Tax=Glarea lozoyensis (strain ATCC 20868 / MF5171) TaxID=1116229 RepID=S3D292_GLAL2|nr:F-box [Glarea lozoyensis ATCC 20868]EPE31259.1 F-box [Glarea lozoyensis ATCC 20868]
MATSLAPIESLPNEILTSILSSFSSRSLLAFTPTCHRFHNVILRLLQRRLLEAASHKEHRLILECYHPSAKFYTPYLYCDYISTPGLDTERDFRSANSEATGQLGILSELYSYFRPLKPIDNRRSARPHPAGGWPILPPIGLVDKHEDLVCQDVSLESHELFSQLVTTTNLVKLGPKPGVFKSSATIGEGLTRVWREWLSERASFPSRSNHATVQTDNDLLWADSGNHVGLRMNVVPTSDVREPIILNRDEDPPVSYTLQYEELAVRTSQLLLMLETALDQELNHSGKAVVIGSWVS